MLAAPALASNRLPRGVKRISVRLTYPLKTVSGSRKPVQRTLTRAATLREAISATNALPRAKRRGVCPMFVILGPQLTVVFRNAGGTSVAEAQVQVTTGSRGSSGSSACFPIHFSSEGRDASLLGNGWVRMMGRLIGANIS
ncbi:MAG: hypothetical protein ACRDLT_04880 [Solirubrobacteraceae bacterium]